MDKVFVSTQLSALLHPVVFKMLYFITCMQGIGNFKIYPTTLAKILKLREKDVMYSIQTLIDNKLITVSKSEDGYFTAKVNKDEFQKYLSIQLSELKDKELLPVSKDVTWNQQSAPKQQDDMSEDEIRAKILMLQAQLKEKKAVEKMVKVQKEPEYNDLPWDV